MKHLTLAKKFCIIFVMVLSLLLVTLGLSVRDLSSQAESIEEIKMEAVTPLTLLATMNRNIQEVRIDLRDRLLAIEAEKTPEDLMKYQNDLDALRRIVAENMKQLSGFMKFDAEKAAFEQVSRDWQRIEEVILQINQHLDKRELSTARELIFVQCYDAAARLGQSLAMLQKLSAQAVDRQSSRLAERNIREIIVLLGTGSILLFLTFGVGYLVFRDLSGAIKQAARTADSITQGDLTVTTVRDGSDEMSYLLRRMNAMAKSLRETVQIVSVGADQVAQSSLKLSSSSQILSKTSREQYAAVVQAASAMEQFSSGIMATSESAGDVTGKATLSLALSNQGADELKNLIEEIGSVDAGVHDIANKVVHFMDSAKRISAVTMQVKSIAEQTNLLSLNAAIEAARAGEQGRGFAVVAEEVRKLAEDSAQFTCEIEQMIVDMNHQGKVLNMVLDSGMRALQASQGKADAVIALIRSGHTSIEDASGSVQDISRTINEQSRVAMSLNQNIDKISMLVEANDQHAQKSNLEMTALSQTANQLRASVNHFKLG